MCARMRGAYSKTAGRTSVIRLPGLTYPVTAFHPFGSGKGSDMRLGDILVASGLVKAQDIERATERQKASGGRLGENLVALGVVTAAQLDAIIHATPPPPTSLAELAVSTNTLLSLLMKFMYLQGVDSPFAISFRRFAVEMMQSSLGDGDVEACPMAWNQSKSG